MSRLLAPIAALIVCAACASSRSERLDQNLGSGKADSAAATSSLKFVNTDVPYVVIQAMCTAGNGAHRMGTYSVAEFSAKQTMDAIKSDDTEFGCDERDYSVSRDDAVAMFNKFAVNSASYEGQLSTCEGFSCEQNGPEVDAMLHEFIGDPDNVAVFATVPTPTDEEEGCQYFDFHVYRADGTMVLFTFDYTD